MMVSRWNMLPFVAVSSPVAYSKRAFTGERALLQDRYLTELYGPPGWYPFVCLSSGHPSAALCSTILFHFTICTTRYSSSSATARGRWTSRTTVSVSRNRGLISVILLRLIDFSSQELIMITLGCISVKSLFLYRSFHCEVHRLRPHLKPLGTMR
jgi:hypothetical protein